LAFFVSVVYRTLSFHSLKITFSQLIISN